MYKTAYAPDAGNNLHDRDARFVRELLEVNTALTSLDLSHNHFSETLDIGAALGVPRCSLLRLSTRSSYSHVKSLFTSRAAANDYVQVLNLSWNHLRGKGALAVGTSLRVRYSTPLCSNCAFHLMLRSINLHSSKLSGNPCAPFVI